MTNEELKTSIGIRLPSAVMEDGSDFLTINIEATDWVSFAQHLRNDASLQFNFLFCLTCVDWKTHLTMVYHLRSTIHRHELVVKAKVDRINPEIETVCHIWRTAEFHEREVYEMFGVNFLNHPDLRLLILPDGWEGKKPMLKDFEDPINMIRL